MSHDPVNHPQHYTSHPSGVECIQVTEHMGFNLGNAVKYIWRADLKGAAIEDLEKAAWYVQRELEKRRSAASVQADPYVEADEVEETPAPHLPVSDEAVAAMAKNCVRLAQHLLEGYARQRLATRHAAKLGKNVADYVHANFWALDAEVATQAVDNESRN